ncbi:MAG: drug/metabolite transporter (DMT)-like permease [Burkholderiaceae bacterium]|jgi:drug/metabolite transporter (DMT)-like permease
MNDQDNRWIAAMPIVFVLIWSTGFVVAKLGMPHAAPMTFLSWRYALSVVCFVAWAWLSGVRMPRDRAQWAHLAVTGIFMHAGYLGGVWAAVKAGMGAGLSALIVGLQPVLTGIFLSYTGSKVSPKQWLGLALGLVGLLLVVSNKLLVVGEVTWFTLSLAVMALLSITTGTLYQKRFVKPCDVRAASSVQLLAAFAVTAPLAWLEQAPMVWVHDLVIAMLWSVLALTLGASSLLYMLIQRGAATAVTSLIYLVPPCAAVLAWLMFDEALTAVTVLGMAVTVLGVAMVRPGSFQK